MNIEHKHNLKENPLAGDEDRFVHPDETRTDEEIKLDRRYAVESYDDDDELDSEEPEDKHDDRLDDEE